MNTKTNIQLQAKKVLAGMQVFFLFFGLFPLFHVSSVFAFDLSDASVQENSSVGTVIGVFPDGPEYTLVSG
ncbi:hypothetical protein CSB09_03375, partial [Candidatus Gracilibacteria bacterium]